MFSFENDELVLYSNPMSRGRVARWMLEEIGVPYEVKFLDYGTTMKAPAYLAINPMGKVPALTHNGKVITENAAICVYLAEAFPQAGLGPKPVERADYYRWMFFAAGPLEYAATNHVMGLTPPADRAAAVGYGSYDSAIDTLEYAVTRMPFIAGDRFTAADLYVGALLGYSMQFGTIPKRPAFEAYHAKVSDRQAANGRRSSTTRRCRNRAAPDDAVRTVWCTQGNAERHALCIRSCIRIVLRRRD